MAVVLGEKKSGSEIQELLRRAKGSFLKKGDAEAQFKLGKAFSEGIRVDKDEVQAAEWFRRAAHQGHAEAQFRLGLMYVYGEGVLKIFSIASEWVQKAASQNHELAKQALLAIQGNGEAQYKFGLRYLKGEGVPQNEKIAFEWLQKASDQKNLEAKLAVLSIEADWGSAAAQFNLGLMYMDGEGVPQNEKIACEWYQKAVVQGNRQAIQALQFIEAIKSIENDDTSRYLSFPFDALDDIHARRLAKALTINTTEDCLSLTYSRIGDSSAIALAKALEVNKTLQTLYLGRNWIGDIGAIAFAKMLETNKALKNLSLGENQIGQAGVTALAKALETNNSLQILFLGARIIGETGVAALSKMLEKNKTLRKLSLDSFKIGEVGAAVLSRGLRINRTLQCLYLSSNFIQDAGATALSEVMKENISLQEVVLNSTGISVTGVTAFAKMLETNNTLTRLELGRNYLGDAAITVLAQALKTNKGLSSLSLYQVKIGDIGAEALAEMLESNKVLRDLDIVDNEIGDPGAIALAKALEANKSLQTLRLHKNQVSDTGAKALMKAMETNKILRILYLDDDKISKDILTKIDRALERNKAFTKSAPIDTKEAERTSPSAFVGGKERKEKKEAAESLTPLSTVIPVVLSTVSTPVEKEKATKHEEALKVVPTGAEGPLSIPSPVQAQAQAMESLTTASIEKQKIVEQPVVPTLTPVAILSTSAETKVSQEAVMLTPELLQFITSLKTILTPEVQQQLTLLSKDELRVFQDWTGKIANLEASMVEAQSKLALDADSKREQEYINANLKLKNYQQRLEAELNRFILCYYLAPAGIFKLDDNKKDLVISAIGGIPMAGQYLKILTTALSAANKKYRLYQINKLSELFSSVDEMSKIIRAFTQRLTLAKEDVILQQREDHYKGIDRLKGFYQMVKEALEHQKKDLAKSDKTGVTLPVEDKLAVLDCAYLLQQIMSGKVPIDKSKDISTQFITVITGEPYKARVLPTPTFIHSISSVSAGATAQTAILGRIPNTEAIDVKEMMRELKEHRERTRAQDEKQKALELQLSLQAEEAARREREFAEMREFKRKMEELAILTAGGGGSQVQASMLPFTVGAGGATESFQVLHFDSRLKRLERGQAIVEDRLDLRLTDSSVSETSEEDDKIRQQLFEKV